MQWTLTLPVQSKKKKYKYSAFCVCHLKGVHTFISKLPGVIVFSMPICALYSSLLR